MVEKRTKESKVFRVQMVIRFDSVVCLKEVNVYRKCAMMLKNNPNQWDRKEKRKEERRHLEKYVFWNPFERRV